MAARWQREAWSGLGRGKNWINRPFEERDSYPVWVAELSGVTENLIRARQEYVSHWLNVLESPRCVFEWQARDLGR